MHEHRKKQEFIKSIESENLARDAAIYFDQIMLMYNFFGHRDVEIILNTPDYRPATTFTVKFDDMNETYNTYDSLNNSIFTVYDRPFTINIIIVDDYTLEITLVGA